MAKITYFLGAGASYQSCPILEKQAEAMIYVAETDLYGINSPIRKIWKYENLSELQINSTKHEQILWCLKYFGLKAIKFGTIDTYAKKLNLQGNEEELNLLKLSVSVFFDLWENFYEKRYLKFNLKNTIDRTNEILTEKKYQAIDPRYISLFSIFLIRGKDGIIKFNKSVNFITWNYDLQLEETFKLFTEDTQCKRLAEVNNYFPFSKSNSQNINNQVCHLNGHRGYYDYEGIQIGKTLTNGHLETLQANSYESYWQLHASSPNELKESKTDYNRFINYAWEHKTDSSFFNNIKKILSKTEILVIIGYSFPLFNREIDENLLKSLNYLKVKEIVYQDPNANLEILQAVLSENILRYVGHENNIKIKKEIAQFYIPNNFNREFTEKEIYV
ncbi:MAG: hypothetical protein ACSHW7_11110 [Patiriisocius sp.]|uniref:hypothetical protein n=1 Tax=Patiriisocius sp. TaxID=2822396 RepID=UPI003EF1E023